MKKTELIHIGTFGRSVGLKGYIKINILTSSFDFFKRMKYYVSEDYTHIWEFEEIITKNNLNLPSSPSAGDTIAMKDYAGTFGTNSLTIGRNGKPLQGGTIDAEVDTNRASVVCVFIDDTKGWLVVNDANNDAISRAI